MYEKSNTLVVNEETDTTILKIEVFFSSKMEGTHICDLKILLLDKNSRENSHMYVQGDMYKNSNHLGMV